MIVLNQSNGKRPCFLRVGAGAEQKWNVLVPVKVRILKRGENYLYFTLEDHPWRVLLDGLRSWYHDLLWAPDGFELREGEEYDALSCEVGGTSAMWRVLVFDREWGSNRSTTATTSNASAAA